MKEAILQMVRENPRTVKELSEGLGISKDEVLSHLNGLSSVKCQKIVSRYGRGRPVVLFKYCCKGEP
jgi:predicted ArsR family transcriptional regulator